MLQRRLTALRKAPPPSDRAAYLHAIARLWPSRRTPSSGTPAPTPASPPPPAEDDSEPARSTEYSQSLRLLKAEHAALSAERTELDQASERQREQVADLEARLTFLRRTLQGGTERSSLPPTAMTNEALDYPAPASGPGPIADYQSAVAAAYHWQTRAAQLSRELQALNQLVRIDSLTGLHNRRSFDEHLPREVARAQRIGEPFCLLMIDVDDFKRLNDSYGHPAGDAVLRSIASSIAGCTRPSDHVARYGGEEFAVVLTEVDVAQAYAVAERIRRRVQLADHCPHPVTISIGLAEYRPQTDGGPGADELVAEADRALYTAKRCGKNRVYAATRKAPAA